MADTLTAAQQVERLERNEKRVNTWVNTMDSYSTEAVPPREVPSIPALMEDLRGRMLVRILRGEWQPDTEYQQNNVVERPGNNFICARGHTSGQDFDADLAAGLWVVDSVTIVSPADTATAGIGYKTTAAEAAAGVTDAARGEYPAFIGPEELAVFADIHWPKAATQNKAGVVMLATPEDINEEDPTQTDNSKAVTPRMLQDGLRDALSVQATDTQLGRVYLPTPTELASGEPDEGREGLSIVLPLGTGGGGLTSATLYTESTEVIAEKTGYALVFLCGGGGAGGANNGSPGKYADSGGGGSGSVRWGIIPITAGGTIDVTVGAGGIETDAQADGTVAPSGGNSSVKSNGVTITALGGKGGTTRGAPGVAVDAWAHPGLAAVSQGYQAQGGTAKPNFWGTNTQYGAGGLGGSHWASYYVLSTAGTQGCVLLIY